MLKRLWNDDRGAVVSVELLLVLGIVVFGSAAGMREARNNIVASYGTMTAPLMDVAKQAADDARSAAQTPPPYAAKTLSHSQGSATSYSVSGSNTNVYVNVSIPSRSDLPAP